MALRLKDGKENKVYDIYKAIVEGKVSGVSQEDVTLVTDREQLRMYDVADFAVGLKKGFEYLENLFKKMKGKPE